jgi:hypothetical protein
MPLLTAAFPCCRAHDLYGRSRNMRRQCAAGWPTKHIGSAGRRIAPARGTQPFASRGSAPGNVLSRLAGTCALYVAIRNSVELPEDVKFRVEGLCKLIRSFEEKYWRL